MKSYNLGVDYSMPTGLSIPSSSSGSASYGAAAQAGAQLIGGLLDQAAKLRDERNQLILKGQEKSFDNQARGAQALSNGQLQAIQTLLSAYQGATR